MFLYTVKSGDSLYKIARKYNTTVDEIIDLNNLKTTNLSIGQVLRIPETYTKEDEMTIPNYINYTVKRGDTLYSIARNNNVSIDTILKDNALTSNTLMVGQNLRIRTNGNTSTVFEECFGPDYTPPTMQNYITYTVKRGDNLYNIASRYNTSVSAITSLNNLSSNNLSIGQVLKIPSSTSNTPSSTTYVVRSGDNLYSIARRFNTSVDAIKRKNNLTSNNISIGQKLII